MAHTHFVRLLFAGELWLNDIPGLNGSLPVAFLPEQSLQVLGIYLTDVATTTSLEVDIADVIIRHPNLSKCHLLIVALFRVRACLLGRAKPKSSRLANSICLPVRISLILWRNPYQHRTSKPTW